MRDTFLFISINIYVLINADTKANKKLNWCRPIYCSFFCFPHRLNHDHGQYYKQKTNWCQNLDPFLKHPAFICRYLFKQIRQNSFCVVNCCDFESKSWKGFSGSGLDETTT